MKTIAKITNQSVYDKKVVSVDTSGLTGFHGTIEIIVNETDNISNEDTKTFTGEHGPEDYQNEYGFILYIL